MSEQAWRKVAQGLREALLTIWGDRQTGVCQVCGDVVQEDPFDHFVGCKVRAAILAHNELLLAVPSTIAAPAPASSAPYGGEPAASPTEPQAQGEWVPWSPERRKLIFGDTVRSHSSPRLHVEGYDHALDLWTGPGAPPEVEG